jgi:vacuolar protein sorting-associated protein 13A/C
LGDIHDRNRRWTWEHFAERRDDRKAYVELFKKQMLNQLTAGTTDAQKFEALEQKLVYEDIRFYRSIARSELRKDLAAQKRLEYERARQAKAQPQQQQQGWGAWLWGSSATTAQSSSTQSPEEPSLGGPMTEQQKKELYDMLDYDENAVGANSFDASGDALKARVSATLRKGSFALKQDPHGAGTEILSITFDTFQANLLQRPDNFEAVVSLGSFGVFDGTTGDTLYSQIVHVKDGGTGTDVSGDPFFFLKFENKPLDERADMALAMRLRHMEIIYHKGYVEAVYRFFKPPESQLESVEALLSVASQTLEGIRRDTRAGLEYALQTHKTIDIQMDLNAPVIIVPEE